MNGNSFGRVFRITSFGESHGKCVGVVVDGCLAGLKISEKEIQEELDRRRPGQSEITTSRVEKDKVEILSGIFNGKTTGAPICMLIWNKDVRSEEYEKIKDKLRPSHADFTAWVKYGGFNDYRGGGRFSGRITAGFVMAGAIAKKLLKRKKIEVSTKIAEVGGITEKEKWMEKIQEAKKEKDSIGVIIEATALNVPPGIGEPVFDTLEGDLAKAIFSIPGVKGIEFGSGFQGAKLKGSENNDEFVIKDGKIVTKTNNAGGILGGISTGMPIKLRVAIKPTSSIGKVQKTVNIREMKETELKIVGRHDPCIVPRAVPIIESMMAIVLVDHLLRANLIPSVLK